jgi:hypothetical protein
MVTVDDIPDSSTGLIWVEERNYAVRPRIIRVASRLHKEKVPEGVLKDLMLSIYFRYWRRVAGDDS